jgi:hypothetical protein
MREPNYNKRNSLFHGKSEKRIKTTRVNVNVVHEDKCKPTPKDVGGEGTS